jgi:hypothetical protein
MKTEVGQTSKLKDRYTVIFKEQTMNKQERENVCSQFRRELKCYLSLFTLRNYSTIELVEGYVFTEK